MRAHTHTHTYTYTHSAHTHTHIRAHTHTHTYTYTFNQHAVYLLAEYINSTLAVFRTDTSSPQYGLLLFEM